MKIFLFVLCIILLLIFAVLMLPVNLKILCRKGEEPKVKVSVLGIDFSTKSKNSKHKKANKPNSLNRNLKKLKQGFKNNSLSASAENVKEILTSVFDIILNAVSKCRLKKFNLKLICAENDAAKAAVEYGIASAVIYPFIGIIKNKVNCSKNAVNINLGCKYNSDETEFLFETVISFKVLYLVSALIKFLKELIKKQIKNK